MIDLADYKYNSINKLLNEILNQAEEFVKLNNHLPDDLRLNVLQYYDILTHNPSLIKKIDKSNYHILGMRVIF